MEFVNENIQSENPFVDILMKNLKILIYNSIIKDEYAADKAETAESLDNAEVYMACMENRVTLSMFKDIPNQFLRDVGLPEHTIKEYNNLKHFVDVIPKDSGGIDANGRLIKSGDTVIRVNDKWYIPVITDIVDDVHDLPLYASDGEIYRVRQAGGIDSAGTEIKANDLLLRANNTWSVLPLKIVDMYSDLPSAAQIGDIYIILKNEGIIYNDAKGIPIQEGNTVIKLKDGWHVVNPYMVSNFLDIPSQALPGDIYKIMSSGGYDANNKAITSECNVVYMNKKWYVLNTHREIDNITTLSSVLVASQNGIYFEFIDDKDRVDRNILPGNTVVKIIEQGYSLKYNNRFSLSTFNNDPVFTAFDPIYQVKNGNVKDSSGKTVMPDDLIIKIDDFYYIVTMYTISTQEELPDLQDLKNGDVYHINELNINVGKVNNKWYLFSNSITILSSITEDFIQESTKNIEIEFRTKRWYIVNASTMRTINSFYDLPNLSPGDLCKVLTSGIDVNGKEIQPGDVVIRFENNWYKVSLYRTDTYESLQQVKYPETGDLYYVTSTNTNAIFIAGTWYICRAAFQTIQSLDVPNVDDGVIYTVLTDGGIDSTGAVIKAGDHIIRINNRWYICSNNYTVYKRDEIFTLDDGDTFKVLTAGGRDENGNNIKENDTLVCIDKKLYLCAKSIKTSVDSFLNLPSEGVMYTIKEAGGISKNSTIVAGDTIILTDEGWEKINLKVVDSYIYLPYNTQTGNTFLIKDSGTTFRAQLVKKLRPWFLLNYTELNEYYRQITGKPALDDWGIPVRDFADEISKRCPTFIHSGDFIHEIGPEACKELERCGVLDIIKQTYPNAKYLDYVTAGLSSYQCRKALDFMILWNPEDCDEILTREFKRIYLERRDFLLRTVYNSAMEIESEHYHATMQLYLLVMVMVDMLAEVQTHIIKKDVLDRRCLEFIFSMFGVPYYKEIPIKYQKRLCYNLHKLIKYKACIENFTTIKEVFDMDDLEFYKYYLLKMNYLDKDYNLIWNGENIVKCIYNDEYVKVQKDIIAIPKEKDLVIDFPAEDYIENNNKFVILADNSIIDTYSTTNKSITIAYNTIKTYQKLTTIFIHSDIGVVDETVDITPTQAPTSDAENVITIPFPIKEYNTNGNYFHIIADDTIFTKYYKNDDGVSLLYRDISSYSSIKIRFIYSNSTAIETIQTTSTIDLTTEYIIPTYITSTCPISEYVSKGNQVIVTVDNTILATNKYTVTNNTVSIKYANIKDYTTLEILYIYSTTEDRICKLEIPTSITGESIDIPEPCKNYTSNNWPVFVIADNKLLSPSQYDIIDAVFETYPRSNITQISQLKFVFFYLNISPYRYEQYEENFDQTKFLRFSKIPMSNMNAAQQLLDPMNWKKYDIVIHHDPWWIGKNYRENEDEIVQQAILESDYNYLRTKYFSIQRIIELSTSTTQISLFYSALFDDTFQEEYLNLNIPSLSNTALFNIGHLFIYMTALTNLFYGTDDSIEPVPEHLYTACGINYKADLKEIKSYVETHGFAASDFSIIWNLIIPKENITDLNEFVRIQKNNEEIYYKAKYKMVTSNTYKEYKMWRYIIEKVMVWDYNQKYFKLNNGNLATSYSEFLEEKNIILYNSLMSIKTLEKEIMIDTIYNIIDDICYILEQYIDKSLARYIFSNIVGKTTSQILKYIVKIVEFFKSVKIMMREKGEVNILAAGPADSINEDTSFLFYDDFASKCISRKNEYLAISEKLCSTCRVPNTDSYTIKEDCVIIHKVKNKEEDIINVD